MPRRLQVERRYKKLDNNNYAKVHAWVKRRLGKASFCSNDHTHKSTQFEWANISGEYKKDLNDYKPLCPSCHRKMDFTEEERQRLVKMSTGNTYRAKSVRQYTTKGRFIKKWGMIKTAAESLGILETSIANNLSGLSKTAGGFTWKYQN